MFLQFSECQARLRCIRTISTTMNWEFNLVAIECLQGSSLDPLPPDKFITLADDDTATVCTDENKNYLFQNSLKILNIAED